MPLLNCYCTYPDFKVRGALILSFLVSSGIFVMKPELRQRDDEQIKR